MEQCGGVGTGMAALASPPVVDPSCNVNRHYLPHVLAMGHNQHWYMIATSESSGWTCTIYMARPIVKGRSLHACRDLLER